GYTPAALRSFVEESLQRTGLEYLDLIQLHCPPTEVYYRPEIFEIFSRLKEEGKVKHFGVSVEKVEEGLKAMEYENVETVQIIFNLFRQRPKELFFEQVKKKNIGVIVRVPLASGLLTGKFDRDTNFGKEDHRNFNRNGEAFDKGETFSGLDFEKGLKAVDQLKQLFPEVDNLAPIALEWILSFSEVSCIIPGASKVDHVQSNLSAVNSPDLDKDTIEKMNRIYDEYLKPDVHQRW
ncbi:MAG: aldo/keto reductase, partial [Salegentibacter sp.]